MPARRLQTRLKHCFSLLKAGIGTCKTRPEDSDIGPTSGRTVTAAAAGGRGYASNRGKVIAEAAAKCGQHYVGSKDYADLTSVVAASRQLA